MTRWFEDIETDSAFDLGTHLFTAEEIQRFGKLYDPQYFHVSAENASHGPFGGLVASGWHTACVGHRLMVDALDAESERLRSLGQQPGVSGPSPGVNSMVFKAPVRPGDSIDYRLIVTGKRPSASLPGWGVLFNTVEGHNRRGELVYRAEVVAFSKLRDYRPSLGQRLRLALKRFQQKWLPLLRFGNATK
jgi:acyl dehydratase